MEFKIFMFRPEPGITQFRSYKIFKNWIRPYFKNRIRLKHPDPGPQPWFPLIPDIFGSIEVYIPTVELILDGSSEIGAHVRSKLYLVKAFDLIERGLPKRLFFMRAHHDLSYHII